MGILCYSAITVLASIQHNVLHREDCSCIKSVSNWLMRCSITFYIELPSFFKWEGFKKQHKPNILKSLQHFHPKLSSPLLRKPKAPEFTGEEQAMILFLSLLKWLEESDKYGRRGGRVRQVECMGWWTHGEVYMNGQGRRLQERTQPGAQCYHPWSSFPLLFPYLIVYCLISLSA